MDSTAQITRPNIAETVVHATASISDSSIGACCEILADTSLHTAELGNYSYLGPRCMVGDATIGKFCAIAAEVRIGAPNHPMDRPSMHRFSYCPEYYSADAVRDDAFFDQRKQDRAIIGWQLEARVIQNLHAGLFHEAEIQRVVQMVQGV